MKKQLILILAALCLLVFPVFAMQHGGHDMNDKSMEHDTMDHSSMNHDSMAADGEMVMLGNQTVAGVEAIAHIKDVRAAMADMKMPVTHHFMIMAKDQHGSVIDSGTVAVKIKGPDGTTSKAIKLMGMGGHFGADIELDKKGMYTFQVGSKLSDGSKRSYEFSYHFN